LARAVGFAGGAFQLRRVAPSSDAADRLRPQTSVGAFCLGVLGAVVFSEGGL